MNIKEIINSEKWQLPDATTPLGTLYVSSHNTSLRRIAELIDAVKAKDELLAKRGLDNEAESAALKEQNIVMMSLLREFYDNGYSQAKCWDVICKHGGDA